MKRKYRELRKPSFLGSEHWYICDEHNIPFPKGAECPACESENKKIAENNTSDCSGDQTNDCGFQNNDCLVDNSYDCLEDIMMKCNFCGHPLEKVCAEISAPPSKRLVKILGLSEDTEVCRRFRMCESCYNSIIVRKLVKEK